MSARSFRSLFMVASCAGAALGCYLVSLNVASERAALEEVEARIVHAQRDIRLLQTEIGTRGRLAQLERWNVKVLALSAPSADQFLEGGFQLARLARPEPQPFAQAPVVLASAPAPQPRAAPLDEAARAAPETGSPVPAARLMRAASLKLPERGALAEPASRPVPKRPETPAAGEAGPVPAAKARAPQKAGDNKAQAAAAPVTKPVRTAKVDPLAPLPSGAKAKATAKESGTAR